MPPSPAPDVQLADAVAAVLRLAHALDRAEPVLAGLVRQRLAYESAARLGFGPDPVGHADLFDALFARPPAKGDRLQRREGVHRAAEAHAALFAMADRPVDGRPRSWQAPPSPGQAVLAAVQAQLAVRPDDPASLAPTVAALRALAAADLLPPPLPPVAWRVPQGGTDAEIARGALRAMTDAFVSAERTVTAARAFADRATAELAAAGERTSRQAKTLAFGLAGLPVLTHTVLARALGEGETGIGKTQFRSLIARAERLGLACEVTGRRKACGWVAASDALTPSFVLPGGRVEPPRADRLAARDALDLARHDAAAADAMAALDAVLPSEG